MAGLVRLGWAGTAGRVGVCPGCVGLGEAGMVGLGSAGQGFVWHGMAGKVRYGWVSFGLARQVRVWLARGGSPPLSKKTIQTIGCFPRPSLRQSAE